MISFDDVKRSEGVLPIRTIEEAGSLYFKSIITSLIDMPNKYALDIYTILKFFGFSVFTREYILII